MELYLRFPGGRYRAFTTSYDDGVDTDVRMIGLMKKNGIRGTFNIDGGLFTPEGTVFPAGIILRRLTCAAARTLYDTDGVEVAVHGFTHPFLNALPHDHMVWELLHDRETLENLFGVPVRGCALPFGAHDKEVDDALKLGGFSYCRLAGQSENFQLPDEPLALVGTAHHANGRVPELLDKFLSLPAVRTPKLFYLWGHTYEFEYGKGQNSWEFIEDFLAKAGGHDDVWYATNGEIVDYLTAWKRLETTLDGTVLHNPSAVTLYFVAEGRPYTLAPGETISLKK